jgi:hypothetical protein
MRDVGIGVRKRRTDQWVPRHVGWRRAVFGAAIAGVLAIIVIAIRLILHPVYSAGSPKVRITVSGGCPQSLGHTIDVSTPGPSWWSEFVHTSRLARSGATEGLVCQYAQIQSPVAQPIPTGRPSESTEVAPGTALQQGTALASIPPPPPYTLQSSAVLTRAQAGAVSQAAFTQSTRHPSGTFHCPAASDGVIIVALSYPTGADADIWWNDTGCQNADNGHVEVYFYGAGLSGGDFTGAVEKVFPAAP